MLFLEFNLKWKDLSPLEWKFRRKFKIKRFWDRKIRVNSSLPVTFRGLNKMWGWPRCYGVIISYTLLSLT